MARFHFLAVNDRKDFCECCGRQGLKKVVWIYDELTDEEKHFGTSCATEPQKGFELKEQIRAGIKRFEHKEENRWRKAHYSYKQKGGVYVKHPTKSFTWIAGDTDLLERCYQEQRC